MLAEANFIAEQALLKSYGTCSRGRCLRVQLTDQEAQFISMLRSFSRDRQVASVMRIAGGWVRDKLLGLPSDDLDVAIDNMMGADFAAKLQSYLEEQGEQEHRIAVIKTNPDRSKHLETATTKILGLHVDFVNLRSETYHSSSRIPETVAFGSPSQDAFRRDININALFFNVHSLAVEDHTGFGLRDLCAGIIQTPLEPKATFLDDPLRILRCIRFACRLDYHIVGEVFTACLDDEVRFGLVKKVSRERVGVELEKILHSKNCLVGLKFFVDMKIADLLFSLPNAASSSQCSVNQAFLAQLHEHLERFMVVQGSIPVESLHIFYLSLCLLSHYNVWTRATERCRSLAAVVVRDSLKLSNAYIQAVEQIFCCLPKLSEYLLEDRCWTRQKSGLLIRECGALWKEMLLLIHILYPEHGFGPFQRFMSHVCERQLEGCWKWRAILSGHEISALLGIPQGAELGRAIRTLLEWQLDDPPQKSPEEAKQFLLRWHGERKRAGANFN